MNTACFNKEDLFGGISFFFGALRAPKKNEIPLVRFHAAEGEMICIKLSTYVLRQIKIPPDLNVWRVQSSNTGRTQLSRPPIELRLLALAGRAIYGYIIMSSHR